jgi:hypothetical protein
MCRSRPHRIAWEVVCRLAVIWSLGGFLSGPPSVHADLFGDARRQTPVTFSQTDSAGASLRGGLQMQTYLPPRP